METVAAVAALVVGALLALASVSVMTWGLGAVVGALFAAWGGATLRYGSVW